MSLNNYHVQQIKREEARPWILTKHYAHRMPSVSWAFGLYDGVELIGVCTFGSPASPTLCEGLCGKEYKHNVLEFNRLCLRDNKPNEGSFLVGRSLKKIPKPMIIVSFADTSEGHVGYIYQATNWIYTGLIQNHNKALFLDGKKSHSRTLICKRTGCTDIETLKGKYGSRLVVGGYEEKHRYVYFVGSKSQKKQMKKDLIYLVLPYPKGESKRYDAKGPVPTQQLLFQS